MTKGADLEIEILAQVQGATARMQTRAENMKALAQEQERDRLLLDSLFRSLLDVSIETKRTMAFATGITSQVPCSAHAYVDASVVFGPPVHAGWDLAITFPETPQQRMFINTKPLPAPGPTCGAVRGHFAHRREPAALEERRPKYEVILELIASNQFDVGLAARAIYGDDSERSRNKVHAGVAHLRDQGRVVRLEGGSLRLAGRQKIRSGSPPVENGRGR